MDYEESFVHDIAKEPVVLDTGHPDVEITRRKRVLAISHDAQDHSLGVVV